MSSSLLWTNKVFLTFLDLLTLTLVSLKRSDRPNSHIEVGRRTQTVLASEPLCHWLSAPRDWFWFLSTTTIRLFISYLSPDQKDYNFIYQYNSIHIYHPNFIFSSQYIPKNYILHSVRCFHGCTISTQGKWGGMEPAKVQVFLHFVYIVARESVVK